MSPSLFVIASGMVTALGYNAPASCAAMRAGISGVRSESWPDDASGEPIRCARVSLPQRWEGVALLADLVAPAIDECLVAAALPAGTSIPLLIGVAARDRPGRPVHLDEDLLRMVHDRLGQPVHPRSRVFAGDQTGCAHALHEAERLVHGTGTPYAIVAGVDSFLHEDTLESYAGRRRLLTPANFNGFLPGEAGAAVLVAAGAGLQGGLCISGWGGALEIATIDGTQPLNAVAMTEAARAALRSAGIGMADIGFRVTDLSGEHYKFKEAMFVLMRLDQVPRERPLELWHPIEFVGEIGAAILPCILAWTWHAFRNGYAPGRKALCHVGADGGERFALVMHEVEAERQR